MTTKERTKRLRDANLEAQQELKGRKGIDKRVTTFKGDTSALKDGEAGGTGTLEAGPMAPNEEQLVLINTFTRSPKTAEELVVFPTLSCNDLYDRDDERFVTQTVKEFAALEPPFSFIGKSFMVSHDYTKLPIGRIFDVGTKTLTLDAATGKSKAAAAPVQPGELAPGVKSTFLTNWVYMPNTDANKQFIDNLDFGINWAVSVGVMLEEAKCSLPWCGAPMYMSRFFGAWCQEGHDKGYYYTEDAERDDWGYYEPADPADKGAVKARVDLYGAKDAYELSQCFLGAQFFAALDGSKAATAKGIVKAASARHIPIIGLSAEEAKALEDVIPHLPAKAAEAVRRHAAKFDDEGALKWVDEHGLVYTFNPAEDSEVMCLGKSTDDEDGEEGDDGEAASDEGGSDALGEGSEEQQESADEPADDGSGDEGEDGGSGTAEEQEDDGSDGSVDDDPDDEDDDSGKEASVSKKAVVQALRSLNVPDAVLRAVEDSNGKSLGTVLQPLVGKINDLTGEVATLTPKAVLGDKFIEDKRAEAIDWYVKANQAGAEEGVSTEVFERILDAAGTNTELIDALITQHKSTVQAKFPGTLRRSSFPTDANRSDPGDVPSLPDNDGVDHQTSRTVKRLHG